MGAYSSSLAMGGNDIYDDNEKKWNVQLSRCCTQVTQAKFTQNILFTCLLAIFANTLLSIEFMKYSKYTIGDKIFNRKDGF